MRQGWRHGPYDAEQKLHDALVEFGELSAEDRVRTLDMVRDHQLEPWLAGLVDYDRGPWRAFTLSEMRPGLRVCQPKDPDAPADPADIGVVESWSVDPEANALSAITVRWSDGSATVHHPGARELRRL